MKYRPLSALGFVYERLDMKHTMVRVDLAELLEETRGSIAACITALPPGNEIEAIIQVGGDDKYHILLLSDGEWSVYKKAEALA